MFSSVSIDPTPSMKLLLILLFAVLLPCYCSGSSIVGGARYVELKSQLEILNNTPIKTIKAKVKDVSDCIDINKQPSLDHPLLKNHVIKTKPISHSTNTMINNNHKIVSSSSSPPSSSMKASSKIEILRKLGCPYGTVPIRRTSEEDLIRAKLISKSQLVNFISVGERDEVENPSQGQYLSIAKTRKDSGIDYLGIQAHINVYNPHVTEDQVSTAQLWIENGPAEELNSLQAGWMVSPSLYGDNETRLFGKWKVGGEGCYNILCPGFIQVDKDRLISSPIGPISQLGTSKQYTIKIAISQDGGGNWWLDVEDMKIGYWPAELGFTHLTQGSSVIAWGGLALQLGPVTTTPVPPTGNGYYPHPRFFYQHQCYMRQMKVIPKKTLYWEDPTEKIIDSFATNKNCSDIIYYGHKELTDFAHTLAFGGPGGYCQF